MARKRYTDKFRAAAVVMLEAEGYPAREGALARVSEHLSVPRSTLRGWFYAEHNPPPAEVRHEKRLELRDLLENELRDAIKAMANARLEASYRDLGTVAAIFTDKLQLLDGKPTERNAIQVDMTDDERAERIAGLLNAARARRDGRAPDGGAILQ